MPRTAFTIAKTHKGQWETLATPDDSLIEQKKSFVAFRSDKAHEKFCRVIYQESDSAAQVLNLVTPEAKAEHAKQHAANIAEAEAETKRLEQAQADALAKERAKFEDKEPAAPEPVKEATAEVKEAKAETAKKKK